MVYLSPTRLKALGVHLADLGSVSSCVSRYGLAVTAKPVWDGTEISLVIGRDATALLEAAHIIPRSPLRRISLQNPALKPAIGYAILSE